MFCFGRIRPIGHKSYGVFLGHSYRVYCLCVGFTRRIYYLKLSYISIVDFHKNYTHANIFRQPDLAVSIVNFPRVIPSIWVCCFLHIYFNWYKEIFTTIVVCFVVVFLTRTITQSEEFIDLLFEKILYMTMITQRGNIWIWLYYGVCLSFNESSGDHMLLNKYR